MSPKDRTSPEVRLRVLNELMHVAASSLDMAETFDQVGEQIKQLIDYDRLSFGFLRPGGEQLDVYAITGANAGTRACVPLESSVIGEAILTRRPILIRDFPGDSPYEVSRRVSEQLGVHSAMFVPLESKGRVIGVLLIFAFQRGQFDEEDLDLAATLYNLDAGSNFQDPHHPEQQAANVLFLSDSLDNLAAAFDLSPDDFRKRKATIDNPRKVPGPPVPLSTLPPSCRHRRRSTSTAPSTPSGRWRKWESYPWFAMEPGSSLIVWSEASGLGNGNVPADSGH